MNNMKLLAVVTQLYTYHICSTQKTFWEENVTQVNMKNGGRRNVRKHREIKNGEKYITLYISLELVDLEKIKITYSEPKYYLGRSGKWLITSLGIKAIRRSKNVKKEKFAITEVSLEDFSRIIDEFKDVPY